MNLEPAPRLPKWIFLAIDLGLLVIAFVIVSFAKDPYAPLPFISAVLCVALAAVIGLVPFLIDYAADSAEFVQRERERLAEHAARLQAGTESLARATAHIKAIEEAVHKSAREAETLPYRMQEKLAEFNEALAAKEESDREALETELEQLRGTNADQLKSIADKISKAAADWTVLEIATRKQLTATEASLNKLQTQAADTAAKVDGATATATARLDVQLAAAFRELDSRVAALRAAAASIPASVTIATLAAPAPVSAPLAPAAPTESPTPTAPAALPTPTHEESNSVAVTRDETALAPDSPAPESSATSNDTSSASDAPKPKKSRAPRKPKSDEAPDSSGATQPATAPAESSAPAVATTELAAPSDAEPVAPASAAEPAPESVAPLAAPEPTAELEPTPENPAPENSAPEPVLTLSSDDEPAAEDAPSAGRAESSTSSDGATRLLATAYIGIGNKLFIRGDGPGLSWDHGVPMQFVSIGKWGWSTHDAAGPVRCKLYKNDDLAAQVGEIILEAGRHTEVTATF